MDLGSIGSVFECFGVLFGIISTALLQEKWLTTNQKYYDTLFLTAKALDFAVLFLL